MKYITRGSNAKSSRMLNFYIAKWSYKSHPFRQQDGIARSVFLVGNIGEIEGIGIALIFDIGELKKSDVHTRRIPVNFTSCIQLLPQVNLDHVSILHAGCGDFQPAKIGLAKIIECSGWGVFPFSQWRLLYGKETSLVNLFLGSRNTCNTDQSQ